MNNKKRALKKISSEVNEMKAVRRDMIESLNEINEQLETSYISTISFSKYNELKDKKKDKEAEIKSIGMYILGLETSREIFMEELGEI